MDSYKGFKVGDKAKVISNSGPVRHYFTIDTIVTIKGNGFTKDSFTCEDSCGKSQIIRAGDLKKLPKFSVGDKVRRHNVMAKLCTITKVFPDCSYTVNDCGDLRFKESDLVPFDGYRMGDEVWTLKRGKAKIIGNTYGDVVRPFACKEYGKPLDEGIFYPKLSNLLTEAEYKYKKGFIAKTISCKIDFGGFEKAAKTLREFGEITRKINELKLPSGGVTEKHDWLFNPMVGCSRIIGIKPQPKFKSGDVVYYHENDGRLTTTKWEVSHYSDEMVMIRQMSCGIDYRAKVRESDLRLWKEAEFKTRYYIGVTVTGMKPNDYSKVTFLGVCPHTGKDVLCGHLEKGMVDIFHGTRGDE